YLSVKLGITSWCVSRHLHKLQRLGLLRIQPRRYRRRNGTWDTRSNLYKLLSFAGAKVRQLFARLTGLRPGASRSKQKEKKELFSSLLPEKQTPQPSPPDNPPAPPPAVAAQQAFWTRLKATLGRSG